MEPNILALWMIKSIEMRRIPEGRQISFGNLRRLAAVR